MAVTQMIPRSAHSNTDYSTFFPLSYADPTDTSWLSNTGNESNGVYEFSEARRKDCPNPMYLSNGIVSNQTKNPAKPEPNAKFRLALKKSKEIKKNQIGSIYQSLTCAPIPFPTYQTFSFQ